MHILLNILSCSTFFTVYRSDFLLWAGVTTFNTQPKQYKGAVYMSQASPDNQADLFD